MLSVQLDMKIWTGPINKLQKIIDLQVQDLTSEKQEVETAACSSKIGMARFHQ